MVDSDYRDYLNRMSQPDWQINKDIDRACRNREPKT